MREGISIELSATDREQLVVVVADRNSPQKLWRQRRAAARRRSRGAPGSRKSCVWRWQERFMRKGLLREKTRESLACRLCRQGWSTASSR